MRLSSDRIFRSVTTLFALLFSGSVALLFAADIMYADRNAMRELFTSDYISHALQLSLASSLIAALLCLIVAIPTAYALSRRSFPGIMVLDIIADLLIVTPVLVIGISLLVLFRVGGDLADCGSWPLQAVGTLFRSAGDFFIYTKAGVVLAQFFCAVGFTVRTIKTSFDEIDHRTEQVALTLGCSEWSAFRRVTLPLARHGILAGAVLGWLRAFGVFGAVIIVGGAVRNRTEVLPTAIYLEVSIGRLEQAIAVSLLVIAVAAALLIILRAVFRSSLYGSGGRS